MNPEEKRYLTVQLWDLPIRMTHWSMVLLFAFSWWTHEVNLIEWHMRSGYTMLTLILFRIFWGLVGSSSARFSNFVVGPKAVWNYRRKFLSSSASETAGHNPAGGWSVMTMLLLLLLQCTLGLFSTDLDGYYSGALSYMVDFDLSRSIAKLHALSFDALAIVVGLHVVAILFYLIRKRENLIRPMITGLRFSPDTSAPAIKFTSGRLAAAGFIGAAVFVGAIFYSATI